MSPYAILRNLFARSSPRVPPTPPLLFLHAPSLISPLPHSFWCPYGLRGTPTSQPLIGQNLFWWLCYKTWLQGWCGVRWGWELLTGDRSIWGYVSLGGIASGCFRAKWGSKGNQWTVILNRCKGRNDERPTVQDPLPSIKSNSKELSGGFPLKGLLLEKKWSPPPPGTVAFLPKYSSLNSVRCNNHCASHPWSQRYGTKVLSCTSEFPSLIVNIKSLTHICY
jgi:hypothetical protein